MSTVNRIKERQMNLATKDGCNLIFGWRMKGGPVNAWQTWLPIKSTLSIHPIEFESNSWPTERLLVQTLVRSIRPFNQTGAFICLTHRR